MPQHNHKDSAMRCGVVGIGNIGSAVATGLAKAGHDITISKRSAAQSQRLAKAFPNITIAENQHVLDHSDIVFIALNHDVAAAALTALRFRPDHIIISLMAGCDLDALARLVSPAPATTIMIPFPAIAGGGSPILVMGDAAPVARIFGDSDSIIAITDSAELDVFLAAQAILSPVAVMVAAAAKWVDQHGGDANKAEPFLRQLIASSLNGMASDDLIAALNTPDGFNQRLRLYFEQHGLKANVHDGLSRLSQVAD